VKFVTPKNGDAVAVVTRSVESKVVDEIDGEIDGEDTVEGAVTDEAAQTQAVTVEPEADLAESSDVASGATIEGDPAPDDPDQPSESES
jgi:DNA gyrase subunit A